MIENNETEKLLSVSQAGIRPSDKLSMLGIFELIIEPIAQFGRISNILLG